MQIRIDTRSDVPVYRQIIDQICALIAFGHLRIGDRLPSVRELAVDIHVNPNTVARVYRDLAQLGIVETQGGLGTFVRGGREMPGEALREDEYRRQLRAALALAVGAGAVPRTGPRDSARGDRRDPSGRGRCGCLIRCSRWRDCRSATVRSRP